jgi:uncharacterized phiE125 gp8 family phage protein
MSSILLTGPAAEPLSLGEAKAFLRVEHSDDDDLITALIASARTHIEAQSQVALITQSWRIVLDCWPKHGRITVRPGPLKSLNAARVYDFSGIAHTIDTQAFVPDRGASALAFVPWAVPVPGRAAAGIELDVTIGFGDAASDVPEPLRQALRLLASHWYENRGIVGSENATLPSTVADTVDKVRSSTNITALIPVSGAVAKCCGGSSSCPTIQVLLPTKSLRRRVQSIPRF